MIAVAGGILLAVLALVFWELAVAALVGYAVFWALLLVLPGILAAVAGIMVAIGVAEALYTRDY